MTNSVILAGASVRSLAESAVAAGLTPCCVDMFGDADLQLTLRNRGCATARRIEQFSSIPGVIEDLSSDIPLIWTGGLENHPQVLRCLADQRPVYGVTVDHLQRFRSPPGLKSLVQGSGCDVPDIVVHSADRHRRTEEGDWLVKPKYGSGGVNIRRFDPGCQIGRNEYRQRCVTGLSVSALYHCQDGITHMLGTCIQITGEPELGGTGFQFCGTVGPVQLPVQTRAILRRVGQRISEAGIGGIFGADFVVNAADVWLIEVNPRITASHELYDFGRDSLSVLQRHLAAYSGDQIRCTTRSQDIIRNQAVARLIVYLRRDRVVTDTDVNRLLRFRRFFDHQRSRQSWLADIPSIGRLSAGTPFCSVYHVLQKYGSKWKTDTGHSGDIKLNEILSEYTGVRGVNTSATAIRHVCLFEQSLLSDNTAS
ncbi:MAG: ATP-grasp domain-containing protein [Fuerstiella sp.]|nr:ATP-grasp domain-containing protein [Fuerstiella sp.]